LPEPAIFRATLKTVDALPDDSSAQKLLGLSAEEIAMDEQELDTPLNADIPPAIIVESNP
jgi:hypothetical protein